MPTTAVPSATAVPPTATPLPTLTFTQPPTQTPVAAAPVLGSMNPGQLNSQSGLNQALTLGGQFQATDVVIIVGGAANLTLTPQSLTGSQIVVQVPALAAGAYTVVVRDGASGFQSASLPLTVKAPSTGGPLIRETHPAPDPNPVAILVYLDYPADGIELRIYSQAMIMVGGTKLGAVPQGWVHVPMPGQSALNPGTYYYTITGKRNGSSVKASKIGRLVISR
jgi:hypothetical protein